MGKRGGYVDSALNDKKTKDQLYGAGLFLLSCE